MKSNTFSIAANNGKKKVSFTVTCVPRRIKKALSAVGISSLSFSCFPSKSKPA
jgi:hypothetical protein